MSDLIKRQDAIDVVGKLYRYESDRMTALQELQVVNIDSLLRERKSIYQKRANRAYE